MLWRFKSFLIPQHQLVLAIFVRQIRNPLAIRGPSREALMALGRIGDIASISLLTRHVARLAKFRNYDASPSQPHDGCVYTMRHHVRRYEGSLPDCWINSLHVSAPLVQLAILGLLLASYALHSQQNLSFY